MHDAIKRDCVWIRAFKQDSKEDLDVVLKNEWLSRKWSLLNPGESKTEESESCVCCETRHVTAKTTGGSRSLLWRGAP